MLKINNKNVFFTSDTHFGHSQKFIYEKRGYSSVNEHDTAIIENINTLVNENDILFHLGDFCLNTTYDRFEEIINSIKCQTIYCLWGNHNSRIRQAYQREISKIYGPDLEVYPFKYKNIIFLGNQCDVIIQGKYVVLNHFPLEVWDHMKDGSYMLCGHSHYSFPRTRKENVDGLTLDCGWEGHGSIYSFNEIIEIMKNKKIRVVDHHAN